MADRMIVSKIRAIHTEEQCLSGRSGSGAVFLTGCAQSCVFCQNFDFNIERSGKPMTVDRLASYFVELQAAGCHNIHWISPTHQLPWLVEALALAREAGLTVPIVYNTGGYESVEVLRLLEGIVEIYLPDFKFWSDDVSWRLLRVRGYPDAARNAIMEMNRQVGQLVLDERGIAQRGLLVRHLVMPGHLDEATQIFRWLAEQVDPGTHVTIMSQYMPLYRASRHKSINRKLLPEEWHKAMHLARQAGLRNFVEQEMPLPPTPTELALKAATLR